MLQAGGLDPTEVQLELEVAQIAPSASDSPHHGSANHSACGSGDGWKFKPVIQSVVTSECPDGFEQIANCSSQITGCGLNESTAIIAAHADCRCKAGCCLVNGQGFTFSSVYTAMAENGAAVPVPTLAAIKSDYMNRFMGEREKAEAKASAPCEITQSKGSSSDDISWPATPQGHTDAFRYKDGILNENLPTQDSQWYQRLLVLLEENLNKQWLPESPPGYGLSKACKQGNQTEVKAGVATISFGGKLNCCKSSCGLDSKDTLGQGVVGGWPVTVDDDAFTATGLTSPWKQGPVNPSGCWAKEHPSEKATATTARVPVCSWPKINGVKKQPDEYTHLIRIAPCGTEILPGCAAIKLTRNETHVEGYSWFGTSTPVDHPCTSPGRGEYGADRGMGDACQASFLAQDVLRKGAGENNSAFNPCGWTIQDAFDYETSRMEGPKDPNNSLSAVEAVSYLSFMKMAANADQLMRNTLAKLRFEIAQSSALGTPDLGDAAFITNTENCSDAAPEEVSKRSDGRVKDCNFAKDNGICSMMHQMCKRSCGQCQEGQGDSQSLTPAPAPDSSIECPTPPSWALTAIKKYSRCNQGCMKPCQELSGIPVEECAACKEPFQCRPGALLYNQIPDSQCQPQCENPCTQLNGDVKRECGGCPAPAKCRPGQPGFDSNHHQQPPCQPQCKNPCSQLNGDVKRECGACSSSSQCRPGAPGFDSKHHHQPQCQPQCENPCTQLNGDVSTSVVPVRHLHSTALAHLALTATTTNS